MSPDRPEVLRVALLVIDQFQILGIRYHLGGSYASSVHGVPRHTQDVDIVAEIRKEHIAPLIGALRRAFYADEEMIADGVANRSRFNLVHLESALKIDIFVKGLAPFDDSEFERTTSVRLDGEAPNEIQVKSPEDILLRKLEWFRDGGEVSDRQWIDILGVIRVQQGQLDLDYLYTWADRLKLTGLTATRP